MAKMALEYTLYLLTLESQEYMILRE